MHAFVQDVNINRRKIVGMGTTNDGDLLRQWRKQSGYSQSELAQRIGITRESVANYENGRANIPEYVKDALDQVGFNAADPGRSVDTIRVRGTKSQIRLLVNLLRADGVPADIKSEAYHELLSALDLNLPD